MNRCSIHFKHIAEQDRYIKYNEQPISVNVYNFITKASHLRPQNIAMDGLPQNIRSNNDTLLSCKENKLHEINIEYI